jgi:hypothetical protein
MLMAANFALSLEPSPFTTEMIASAMPAAINPNSIAVAPKSSARNAFKALIIWTNLSGSGVRRERARKAHAKCDPWLVSTLDG